MELEPDPQLARATLHHLARQIISDFKSQMYPYTESWIEDHLTPENITEIGGIYIDLLCQVRDWGLENVEINLWIEAELMLEDEIKDMCMDYLIKVATLLGKFRNGINEKFQLYFCFTDQELEDHADAEYNKLSPHFFQEKPDIQKLVDLGCKKLMEYYWKKNSQINEREGRRAVSFLPKIIMSYNEQMGTLLAAGVNTQDRLQELHTVLVGEQVNSFRNAFRHAGGGGDRISPNVENKVEGLKSFLEAEFQKHLQKIGGKKLPDINNLLREVKTEYEERVNLLEVQGLEPNELEIVHEEIVTECLNLLEMETMQLSESDGQMAMEAFQNFVSERSQYLFDGDSPNLSLNRKFQQDPVDFNNLLPKFKTAYEERATDLLAQYPQGLEPIELTRKHDEIANEFRKLLEIETSQLERNVGDMTMEAFQAFVQVWFQYLLGENNRNLLENRRQQQERDKRERAQHEAELRRIRVSERRLQQHQQEHSGQEEEEEEQKQQHEISIRVHNESDDNKNERRRRDDDFCACV